MGVDAGVMRVSRRDFLVLAGASAIALLRPAKSVAVVDATADLLKQIGEIRVRGKGVLELPAGDFLVSPQTDRPIALDLPYGVEIRGAGRDRTRVIMAPGSYGHVINSAEGGLRLFDLTVDGQSTLRPGSRGHNVRIEGENNFIERVNIINACSYGIGVGQRRYAVAHFRDVFIGNAGADGIDCKNKLGKTSLRLENILVDRVGASVEQRSSAAIDLRGKCFLEDITIKNVGRRDGLRFRHGEHGEANGAGGHGSVARNVRVQGAGLAFAVVARDVLIENFEVRGAAFGFGVGDTNLVARNGVLSDCRGVTQFAKRKGSARFEKVMFKGVAWNSDFEGGEEYEFIDSSFANCPIRGKRTFVRSNC
jgi:hypothetical protein